MDIHLGRLHIRWCSVSMPLKYTSNKLYRKLDCGRLYVKLVRGVV